MVHWLLIQVIAFLGLILHAIIVAIIGHINADFLEIESLTGPEPTTLYTQMSIMSWFMEDTLCKLGTTTVASLPKWKLYLQDRVKPGPSSVSYLSCPYLSLDKYHSAGDHPSLGPLGYLVSFLWTTKENCKVWIAVLPLHVMELSWEPAFHPLTEMPLIKDKTEGLAQLSQL